MKRDKIRSRLVLQDDHRGRGTPILSLTLTLTYFEGSLKNPSLSSSFRKRRLLMSSIENFRVINLEILTMIFLVGSELTSL